MSSTSEIFKSFSQETYFSFEYLLYLSIAFHMKMNSHKIHMKNNMWSNQVSHMAILLVYAQIPGKPLIFLHITMK